MLDACEYGGPASFEFEEASVNSKHRLFRTLHKFIAMLPLPEATTVKSLTIQHGGSWSTLEHPPGQFCLNLLDILARAMSLASGALKGPVMCSIGLQSDESDEPDRDFAILLHAPANEVSLCKSLHSTEEVDLGASSVRWLQTYLLPRFKSRLLERKGRLRSAKSEDVG